MRKMFLFPTVANPFKKQEGVFFIVLLSKVWYNLYVN